MTANKNSLKTKGRIYSLYIHRFLRKLARSAIAVFIPLYIYQITGSALPVFLFFLAYFGTALISTWPVANLASKIGYTNTAFVSSPFLLIFYYLLRGMESYSPFLYLIGAVGGLGTALYWTGINAEMARSSRKKDRELQAGFFESIPIVASIISPFTGGVVLYFSSFSVLFLAVIVVLGLSFVPLFLYPEEFSGMEVETEVFSLKNLQAFFTFFCRGVGKIGKKALWPLYLAIFITGELSIGGAGSIMALGGALTNLLIGYILTSDNRKTMISLGSLLFAFTWIAMSFVITPVHAFIVAFLNGVFFYVVKLPIYSGSLSIAEEEDVLKYLAFRDIGLNTGRVVTLGAILTLFLYIEISTAFILSFSLIAVGSLGIGYFGTGVNYRS